MYYDNYYGYWNYYYDTMYFYTSEWYYSYDLPPYVYEKANEVTWAEVEDVFDSVVDTLNNIEININGTAVKSII
jgi:hypothetical protein